MPNKYSYSNSKLDLTSKIKDIFIGEVVVNDDPYDMGRIKVRIKGTDDAIPNNNDLPWSFPMQPKFFGSTPQLKEAVIVFIWDNDKAFQDRLYMGPIISQPQNLQYDPLHFSALAGFTFGIQGPAVAPSRVPNVKGVFANKKDIVVQGRNNTDIIFKDNEVLIRAGKFVKKNTTSNKDVKPHENSSEKSELDFEFNKVNPAYIQIKYDAQLKKDDQKNRGSVTNIVSSKINLLTHKDGSPRFALADQDKQITEEELWKILEEAHQLPYGDILLQYLRLLKEAFLNHVHNGHGNPPTDLTGAGKKMAVDSFKKQAEDLENKMLSKNIRIN